MDTKERKLYHEFLNLTAPNFFLDKSSSVVLVVEVHLENLILLGIESETREILFLRDIRPEGFMNKRSIDFLSEFFKVNTNFFSRNWKKVFVNYVTKKSTLVPALFYSVEDKDKFFSFNHSFDVSTEQVLSDYLPRIDSYLLYSVDRVLKELIDINLPGNVLKNTGSIFISTIVSKLKSKKVYLAVNIRELFFEIILFKEEFKFYNSFLYDGVDDLMYFLLASCQEQNLLPSETEILVVGNCDVDSDVLNSIRNYFVQVQFGITEREITRGEVFYPIPSHFYYTLLNRFDCE